VIKYQIVQDKKLQKQVKKDLMKTQTNIQKKRHLGHTDIEITPIGLGVMQFSGSSGFFRGIMPDIHQEQMNAIIKTALIGGINWFDTAEIYGRGRSERGLANGLKAAGVKDKEVVIGTKWFPLFRRASSIPKTIDDRIHFLDGYTIDLYMIHQPWGFSSPENEMGSMADLVKDGKICSVGVSNFNLPRMQSAQAALEKRGLPLAANQVQYSLLNRKIETNGVLDAARETGITIVAWSPLASGLLSGKFHKNPELLDQKPYFRRLMLRRGLERSRPTVNLLEEIAARHEATPGQVALNWLINFKGETVVAIPGASKLQQAEENAGAMKFRLSDEELSRLDKATRDFR